jgi:hypothetical protein
VELDEIVVGVGYVDDDSCEELEGIGQGKVVELGSGL